MAEAGPKEVPLGGGSHSAVVRVGATVRRARRPWSATVQDLLRHLEAEGFDGAPRARGFDEQGREVLTYVEGDVVHDATAVAERDRFDARLPAEVWTDDALVHLGGLLRRFHDAAATFPWEGREWCFAPRPPVETICHHEPFPQNAVFRDGRPVALVDWDTAAAAPRAWDLGTVAWRWVPFFRPERCRAHGLPDDVEDKARRLRLLLAAYGTGAGGTATDGTGSGVDTQPDSAAPGGGTAPHGTDPDRVVRAGVERMRGFLGAMQEMAARGSAHEVALARRGVLEELALEIAWVEEHADALTGRPT